jgi:hypothetical protein
MARSSKGKVWPIPKEELFLVFLFGGVLLAIGTIVPGILMTKSIRGYLKTGSKVSVAADIRELDRVGRSGRRHTQVEYVYRHAGKDHVGTEVSLFGESTSLYPRLLKAYETGRPNPVWIDPDDPSYAVIERDWHWPKMLLAFVFFGGFSALGGYLIRWGRRSAALGPEL